MEMTERARRRLDGYLAGARRALQGHPEFDEEEVVRGLREHVDVELSGRSGPGPVTAAEVDAVLERLGPPDALGSGAHGSAPAAAPSRGDVKALLVRLTVGAVLAVVTVGLLLVPGALVWGQSQIGGLLDAARNPGAPPLPGSRSSEYWLWVVGVVACVTGVWWAAIGAAVARWRGEIGEALAPLRLPIRSRHGRILAVAGLLLAAGGLIVLVL